MCAVGFFSLLLVPSRAAEAIINTEKTRASSWWQFASVRADGVFWLILLSRTFAFLFFHPAFNLSDAMVYSVLGECRALFGRCRSWGSIGFVILALVGAAIGVIIRACIGGDNAVAHCIGENCTTNGMPTNNSDFTSATTVITTVVHASTGNGLSPLVTTGVNATLLSTQTTNNTTTKSSVVFYLPMVVIYDILLVIGAVSIWCFKLGPNVKAHANILTSVGKVFKNPDLAIMFIYLFFAGFMHSTFEAYLFWYVQDLGGRHSIFGLMAVVMSLSEFIVMSVSHIIIRKVGPISCQFIVFAAYFVRCV